ncbi:MAG: Na/Pi cotransporter family protein [Parvibaculaceae bacterium]
MAPFAALIDLAGLIALLLWGVHMIQSGLQRAFGPSLKAVLGSALKNRLQAFAAGIGITTLLQSSTAVGLMAASFVAYGIVPLTSALAVMLGANVGTTLIVQVLSFDIAQIAPALVLTGLVLFRSFPTTRGHDLGRVAIGLGLMLIALHGLIVELEKIDNTETFRGIARLIGDQPALGLIIAAVLTWLAHSSVAVMLLVMSLASQGVLQFETALAFVLGANLGTAVNPWLESRHGDNPATRRLPAGNLINRMAAVAVAYPLTAWLAPLVLMIDDDKGRAVANFHTAFNLANAIVVLPFLTPFEAVLRRLMPDQPDKDDPGTPRYLDKAACDMPLMALVNASREALRMVDVLNAMIAGTRAVLEGGAKSKEKATEVKGLDDALDRLNAAIKTYLTEIDQRQLTEADRKRLNEVFTFITNIEHAGDVIDHSVLKQATKRIKRGVKFSPEGFEEIRGMLDRLSWNLQAASTVFMTEDAETARKLADEKARFRSMESSATDAHFARLRAGKKETQATTSMHLDLVRDLKLINAHLVAAAAYPILEEKGKLLSSRIAEG